MKINDFQTTTIFTILVVCASIIDRTKAIQCFSCAVTTEIVTTQYQTIVTPSCSQFDGSTNFIIDCPFSSMCSRIISTMYLQNGYAQKTITLGCAKQKSSEHVLRNGKWNEEHTVKEVYPEDCITNNDNNLVGATRTYCHCRGNLCNSANQKNILIKFNILLLSFLITLC